MLAVYLSEVFSLPANDALNIFSKYFLSIIVSQSKTIACVFKIALLAFEERWITEQALERHILLLQHESTLTTDYL